MFGFGGSKSSSSSESSSLGIGYGYQGAESGSIGGGTSRSGGGSSQSIAFEDIFSKMFGGASDAAGMLDPSVLTSQANMLFGSGANFLDTLGGGADTAYLDSRISGESPVLQEQIDALGSDIGKFFNEQINPNITSEAVAGGALGGGRQGVAQGMAAEAAGREFQRGVTNLRSADIAARDAAAGKRGDLRIGAAGTGLASLPGLGGIAEMGFGASLAPYAMLSQILGGPMALTESSQFASADDFARSFSESFGENFSYDTSKSKSKSSGKSFSMGMGSSS